MQIRIIYYSWDIITKQKDNIFLSVGLRILMCLNGMELAASLLKIGMHRRESVKSIN